MYLKNLTIVQFLLVFTAVFLASYFYLGYNIPYFTDPDSFYHVGIAKYMMQHGLVIQEFPYFNFTILKDKFFDWHFLFHALLIPFIKVFGEINGPKILGITLLSGAFSVVYLIFREMKLKLAVFYAIILFFLMPALFYLRMSYIRAPVLSLFLMVLCLYWIIKNRPVILAVTMFFFVWAYYLASYFIFVPILALLICQILRQEKINYSLIVWVSLGFLAGLIINPYFPANIQYFNVFFQVGSQNDRWYAGQEIFPTNTWAWFYSSAMAVLLFLGGIVISLIKNIKQDSRTTAILIFTIFILILQWKSARFIEYWPVFGGLTGFLIISPYIEEVLFKIKTNWRRAETWVIIIIVLVFVQEGLFHGIWEFRDLESKLPQFTPGMEQIKEAAFYIKNNSNQGEIVFARWDNFPPLFYFDQKNYYIVGMDPIFFEAYNKNLFEKYIDITMNKESVVDLKVIKNDFKAKWIITDKPQQNLKEKLQRNPNLFEQAFENKWYTVFKVL